MRIAKEAMRHTRNMRNCKEKRCELLTVWMKENCYCAEGNLMNGLSLDEPMLMSAVEETPIEEAPKKKRSRKKKVEEVAEEKVEDIPEVPEILSLEELSK